MYLFKRIKELQQFLQEQRLAGRSIGFAPTMGALHEGHLSLIRRCQQENDLSLCSIFVNPTQFNDSSDLASYPVTIEQDIALLEGANCSILFLPDVNEIYPSGLQDSPAIDLEGLDQPMEGKFRPGHFEGVVQVVNRLLDIVEPHRLYMGQKDFQQLTIIRKMLEQVHQQVKLVMCPVVREADGLAMSSRNRRLTPEYRSLAPLIYQILLEARQKATSTPLDQLTEQAVERLNRAGLKTEYFEFADAYSLRKISHTEDSEAIVLCTAVWAGDVRLIDTTFVKGEGYFTK
jgi:pantoate--beta-alanine ligase